MGLHVTRFNLWRYFKYAVRVSISPSPQLLKLMLCQHLFLASCICILRYSLIWLAPSPTCRLSLPIPAALRYPEPSAGRAGQLWPSRNQADNTTRVLLTSKCIFTGFPLESLAAPTWTRKTRLVKHNGIRRGRQARGGSLLWRARYVAPMMHPFVSNNNYKATVFHLRVLS